MHPCASILYWIKPLAVKQAYKVLIFARTAVKAAGLSRNKTAAKPPAKPPLRPAVHRPPVITADATYVLCIMKNNDNPKRFTALEKQNIPPIKIGKMKKVITIKVQTNCDKGLIRNTMRSIASSEGLESIAVEGEDKDHFIIIGDGIDLIKLTKSLRKKFGHADILTVEPVMNQNDEISASMNDEENLENGF
ncbi:hypothetical protein KFK09_014971 [Dendrobium nobile]|uniref:Uncharacterized protein n=1 Tax=Dendrobium nobile TaxID=94219 RepID=A0A8T3B3J3_DENNO|nr:hypothetical protein KFK09_014971 [Dendrobium nobile]